MEENFVRPNVSSRRESRSSGRVIEGSEFREFLTRKIPQLILQSHTQGGAPFHQGLAEKREALCTPRNGEIDRLKIRTDNIRVRTRMIDTGEYRAFIVT